MVATITAVADSANARIALTVDRGLPGEAFYIFRRDSDGVGIVRDTSLGTVTWPDNLLTVDPVPPAGALAAPWFYQAGTTEAGSTVVATTGDGPEGRARNYVRRTITTAKTTGTSGTYYRSTVGAGPAGVAGDVRTFRIWHRQSVAGNVTVVGYFRSGGSQVGSANSQVVAIPANTWVLLTVTGTASGTYDNVEVRTSTSGVVGTYDTTEAYVLAGAGPIVLYDYEPRQGDATDYLLTDADGTPVTTVTLTIPTWGTWLKSPGRPYLNTPCHYERESPVKRPARRSVVPIEGSPVPLVLAEERTGAGGTVRLATRTAAQSAGLDLLLAPGDTLLLDTAPQWRSPWRYVSVGDLEVERAFGDGQLSLEQPHRVYALADLIAQPAPIGLTVVDPGRTYDTLPTLYANYAAMAATNASYLELAVGS